MGSQHLHQLQPPPGFVVKKAQCGSQDGENAMEEDYKLLSQKPVQRPWLLQRESYKLSNIQLPLYALTSMPEEDYKPLLKRKNQKHKTNAQSTLKVSNAS